MTKPFDLLFKHTMGSDLALKDFVRYHLPGHIYQRIDPNSIQPTKQSYVPPELREIHSDLVCSCTIDRQEALLLLLVEHVRHEVARIKSANKAARLHSNLCYHYFGAMLATV